MEGNIEVPIDLIVEPEKFHRERAQIFSHGGIPWDAMGNESAILSKRLQKSLVDTTGFIDRDGL